MCDYFVLTKPKDSETHNNERNQIITFQEKVYILPKSNINYYLHHGLCENYLIEWSKQLCSKDKIMLDIGAHSGTYTISLANHCKHIYCFEPQRLTYYSLCGSVALSNLKNITCYQFGLGSESQVGKQILNIVSLDGGGSSLFTNNGEVLETEDIEIKTLDSLQIDNIGFIKIDVEDNELHALLGAKETLRRSNYPKILFEMNRENKELLDFFAELRYKIVSIGGFNNMFLAEQ
jgi:hypothetical protein